MFIKCPKCENINDVNEMPEHFEHDKEPTHLSCTCGELIKINDLDKFGVEPGCEYCPCSCFEEVEV